MTDYNMVLLQGRMVANPELRYGKNGSPLGSGTICVNKTYTLKNGQEQQETMFLDIEMFGKTAEFASQKLTKGTKVFIEGHLKQAVWEKEGRKYSKIVLVVERFAHIEFPRNRQEPEEPQF